MRHFVGEFTEQDLITGKDKIAISKAIEETGLKYIQSKMKKKKGKHFIEVHVVDVNENWD
jgi:hypothetical protein